MYVCDGVEYMMEEGFGGVRFFYFYLFIHYYFFKHLVLVCGALGSPHPCRKEPVHCRAPHYPELLEM